MKRAWAALSFCTQHPLHCKLQRTVGTVHSCTAPQEALAETASGGPSQSVCPLLWLTVLLHMGLEKQWWLTKHAKKTKYPFNSAFCWLCKRTELQVLSPSKRISWSDVPPMISLLSSHLREPSVMALRCSRKRGTKWRRKIQKRQTGTPTLHPPTWSVPATHPPQIRSSKSHHSYASTEETSQLMMKGVL